MGGAHLPRHQLSVDAAQGQQLGVGAALDQAAAVHHQDLVGRRANPGELPGDMLGALARWPRALDLDVAYDPALDDAELVEAA